MGPLEKRYQETLDYIYSYVDYSRTHQDDLSPGDFNLSRMHDFMTLIQDPHQTYPCVHIAGSKGKGSVSAMCASVYQTSGYRVGLYTSPHLKDFEERIQVNRVPISRKALVDLVDELRPRIEAVDKLTTFEIMTGLAYLYFARQEVDIAVIEVGLGGRLDATNVITPLISVITTLCLDHTSILGDTLAEIAREKGGIIKPGIPVVTSPQKTEALQVLKVIAENTQSPLFEVGKDYHFRAVDADLDGQRFRTAKTVPELNSPDSEYYLPLLGRFQVINAATAFAVLDQVRERGFPVTPAQVKKGFRTLDWPARFEIARRNPPVVFDSAHNPESIRKIRETVDEFFPGVPLVAVFGISEDKELEGMYDALLPRTDYLITTQADHPRAMDPVALLKRAERFHLKGEAVPEVRKALKRALEVAGNERMILVTGSIFVAATARIAWQDWGKES